MNHALEITLWDLLEKEEQGKAALVYRWMKRQNLTSGRADIHLLREIFLLFVMQEPVMEKLWQLARERADLFPWVKETRDKFFFYVIQGHISTVKYLVRTMGLGEGECICHRDYLNPPIYPPGHACYASLYHVRINEPYSSLREVIMRGRVSMLKCIFELNLMHVHPYILGYILRIAASYDPSALRKEVVSCLFSYLWEHKWWEDARVVQNIWHAILAYMRRGRWNDMGLLWFEWDKCQSKVSLLEVVKRECVVKCTRFDSTTPRFVVRRDLVRLAARHGLSLCEFGFAPLEQALRDEDDQIIQLYIDLCGGQVQYRDCILRGYKLGGSIAHLRAVCKLGPFSDAARREAIRRAYKSKDGLFLECLEGAVV